MTESTKEQDIPTAADDPVDAAAAETMDEDPEEFPAHVFPAGPASSGHRMEPVGNEGLFESDRDEEGRRGAALAALYQKEQEERPADHPLSIAKFTRNEIEASAELSKEREDALKAENATSKDDQEVAGTLSYPRSHAELDELAADNDYEFEGTTVAEKQAELEKAGIQPV